MRIMGFSNIKISIIFELNRPHLGQNCARALPRLEIARAIRFNRFECEIVVSVFAEPVIVVVNLRRTRKLATLKNHRRGEDEKLSFSLLALVGVCKRTVKLP